MTRRLSQAFAMPSRHACNAQSRQVLCSDALPGVVGASAVGFCSDRVPTVEGHPTVRRRLGGPLQRAPARPGLRRGRGKTYCGGPTLWGGKLMENKKARLPFTDSTCRQPSTLGSARVTRDHRRNGADPIAHSGRTPAFGGELNQRSAGTRRRPVPCRNGRTERPTRSVQDGGAEPDSGRLIIVPLSERKSARL